MPYISISNNRVFQFIGDFVKTLGEARFISPRVTGDITARLFVLVLFIPHNSDRFQTISGKSASLLGKGTCKQRTFEHGVRIWGFFFSINLISQVGLLTINPNIVRLASCDQLAHDSALAKD